MWYENEEEKKKKARPEPVQSSTATSGDGPANASANPFPSTMDPTKAFEDDNEDEAISSGAASDDEIGSLKSKIKELDEKANLNYDRYLRALAEMENFKKRAARERADLLRCAGEDLLLEILPVVDNLERTISHLTDNMDAHKIIEGVNLINKQFIQALQKSGVSSIEQAPCAFDPSVHQALQRIDDKSVPDDTVVEILQKGYVLNGKVVRPAMVKVAKH